MLPDGPKPGEIPGRENVPGTEDLGFVTVPPASAAGDGDGDGEKNEPCSRVVGGDITGGS